MGEEKSPAYYDQRYDTREHYFRHYKESPYYVLWTQALQFVKKVPSPKILEIGCGAGQFAHYLYDEGFRDYAGFDFSPRAIEMAKERCAQEFFRADARDFSSRSPYSREYNLVISLEVLEHIEDDVEVIRHLREGSGIVFSVPSFPDPAHLRTFSSPRRIRKRYYQVIRFHDIVTVGRYFAAFGMMEKGKLPLMNRLLKTRGRVGLPYLRKKLLLTLRPSRS